MAETGSLQQDVKEPLEAVGTADIVIGLPSLRPNDDFPQATEIGFLGQKILIACPSAGSTFESVEIPGAEMIRYPLPPADRYLNSASALFGSFQEVFQVSQKVGAKWCCVWNSSPQLVSKEVLKEMLAAMTDQNFDLAVPCYEEVKLGALITSSIVHPVVRALYGRRLLFPMAVDLGFSAQFVDRLLETDPKTQRPRCHQWIATEAISSGVRICQVNLPLEPPRPPESTDVSTILTAVLGRLFQDLERNAVFWQRSSGSQSVPTFGEPVTHAGEEPTVDTQPMIETFQLGYRNLREIWTIALPPATLLELKKLTLMPAGSFKMPDDLWVRIVYDFAMAHRQRAINREHLLRAMTPLYLAWVASYAAEVKGASPAQSHFSLERLALSYEKQKPYLLSRWRWPDRFNP